MFCIGNLRTLIEDEGPNTIAAFFAEPVMGAGGVIPPPATYFEKIQQILREYAILFVVDEVICGFGRTGRMFSTRTYSSPRHDHHGKALIVGISANFSTHGKRKYLSRNGRTK